MRNKSLEMGWALALLFGGCAAPLRPAASGDLHVEGRAYRIAAQPDGHLMPPGWVLVDSAEKRDPLQSADTRDLVMRREEDDGRLSLIEGVTACNWSEDGNNCVRELMPGKGELDDGGLHWLGYAPRKLRLSGGGGTEVIIDGVTGQEQPVWRVYQFWFHDDANKSQMTLYYVSPAATFAAGALDVSSLVKRISFP